MTRDGWVPALVVAALLPSASVGAVVPPRDPFARPQPAAEREPDVRLAGSVRFGGRHLALLVGRDGVGLVAAAGSVLPGPGLRVTAVGDGVVRVQAIGGGEEHVLTAAADAAAGEAGR